MIVDASAWPQAERDAAVDWVFDHPHEYTTEDVLWSAENYGIDEKACRDMFKSAPIFGVIMKDGKPLYIFSVAQNGNASTASEERLEANRWYMTKELVRFRRSELGKRMLSGSRGFAEESDLINGTVRHRWLVAIGYEPAGKIEFNNQHFIHYRFTGGN